MSPFDIPVAPKTEVTDVDFDEEKPKRRSHRRGAYPTPRAPKVVSNEVPLGTPGRTPAPVHNWKVGEYRPSAAMRLAIERAKSDQPPMVPMTSPVRADPKAWNHD